MLCEKERRLFFEEYHQHYLEGETKPREIGEPYLFHNPESKTGVLLIHGLMAAPEEVRQWADALHIQGYTVYAPRLSGHGTSADDLSAKCFEDWLESVDRGHAILQDCCEKIVVAGFSTGAGLALYKALQKPDDICGVISISAPMVFAGRSIRFVELLHVWNRLAGYLNLGRLTVEYVKNHPDNPEINYPRCPVKALVEVRKLMRRVYKRLPSLSVPSLIMQGKNDPKVDARSGRMIFHRIQHSEKHYRAIDYHLHGVIRGEIASGVFDDVSAFLHTICPAK